MSGFSSAFAPTLSLQLAGVITDETGTGALVFGTSPTLTTPVLGVATGTSLALTEAVGASALTLTGATQTASFPVINATQTWNNAGVTFTGAKLNVTNTASAAASMLLDLQVGGTSQFKVSPSGFISIPFLTGIQSSIFTYGTGSNGFRIGWRSDLNLFYIQDQNGNPLLGAHITSGLALVSQLGFGSTTSPNAFIVGEAANVLAFRNGTAATKTKFFNTHTTLDTAGEWFAIDWATTANVINLQAVKGSSTGTARVLTISYGGLQASPVAAISVPITSGNITFGGGITLPGGATFLTTNTALTDGAGASTGTLTNAPAIGNPTKWIGINDNGTTRYIPAW